MSLFQPISYYSFSILRDLSRNKRGYDQRARAYGTLTGKSNAPSGLHNVYTTSKIVGYNIQT